MEFWCYEQFSRKRASSDQIVVSPICEPQLCHWRLLLAISTH